jgi:homoserine kinase
VGRATPIAPPGAIVAAVAVGAPEGRNGGVRHHTVRHHTVQVPATSANLGPGFDAFGLALQRYLVVRTVDVDSQPDRVRIADDDTSELACDDDNLIWRSFVRFCEHHDVPVPDVGLLCSSQIPLERGLGSSSSAIVAGLTLARALTEIRCSDRDLVVLAAGIEGHPDNVAPAVLGGLVVCASDDDGRLVVRRINPATASRPLILVPSDRQATISARAVLPEQLDRSDVVVQAARSGHVLPGLIGSWPVSPALAGDRRHEPARLAVMPGTAAVLGQLRELGVHAWLSGAGPSVAVVRPSNDLRLRDRVAEVAASHGFEAISTGFDLSGALVCPDDGCGLSGSRSCVQCPRRRV